jgi:sialate O-acetylesterase
VAAIERNVDAAPEFKEWLEQRKKRVEEMPQRNVEYIPLKQKYDADMKRWWSEVNNAPEFVAKVKAWEEENQKALQDGKPPIPRPQPSEPRPKAPEPPDGGREAIYMVGNFYNAMIRPLMPYAIKGVIWYQGEGEGHVRNGKEYATLFPIQIADWREEWGQGPFPFLFVQLPNGGKPSTEPVEDNYPSWPGVREAQAKALSLPNTGMATIIDVGDPFQVHGKDKLDVGVRLSLVARHVVYGENLVFTGPTYDSMKIEGNKARIAFKNTGSGLTIGVPPWTVSGKIPPLADEVKGFAIAGVDRKWSWAKASIEGNDVVVWRDQVPHPVAVRYGWANNPPCNLYNKERLPAAPFRTDTWEP